MYIHWRCRVSRQSDLLRGLNFWNCFVETVCVPQPGIVTFASVFHKKLIKFGIAVTFVCTVKRGLRLVSAHFPVSIRLAGSNGSLLVEL
jgi:hypothetical protein